MRFLKLRAAVKKVPLAGHERIWRGIIPNLTDERKDLCVDESLLHPRVSAEQLVG